ncbi:flagellin [Tropicibacter naphthalenivorans]|uniref:Flagellar hook-associated protein FlgL n=1 Tax=Tropicibacter naphthalenivorans TaxID=441103 RepID=A0A0P1GYW2_9RHOB|nr:flagellin [Tropicibacter naphthalenivorans]CUH79690.1 flagellar hook-associated protein FlgL [Tropicibacter naphthalenivorans]SMC74476.1 flagellar hook-associated protein 3 FlgL [Tropicibacter naphthalenivorans]
MESVGDMARALVLRTNQAQLRSEMDQLAVEVATGLVKDPAQHLKGDLTGLMAIDRTLSKLDTYRVNTTEATFLTGSMQTALDEIQSRTELLSQSLISAELTPNSSLLSTMAQDAENAFAQVLNGLNRSVAGRFMFSGTATDRPAVQDVDTFLGDLRTAVSGSVTLADVETALDTFFGAGGTYETTTYQGSTAGIAPLRLSETETANVDIRATDPVFRDVLKPLVMAALSTDGSLGLSQDVQVEMLAKAGRDLLGAQQGMVELRAGLGALEARVEETTARNSAERTATSIAKLDLVGADAYETATRYETIRTQLESLYAITARSQRLSLAEFL